MANPVAYLLDNPFVLRDRARWRRNWLVPAAFALAFTFLGGLFTAAAWGALLNPADPDGNGLAVLAPLQLLAGLAPYAWTLLVVAVGLLVAAAINRERLASTWDIMRSTGLAPHQIFDGCLTQSLLRYPLWLILPGLVFVQMSPFHIPGDTPAPLVWPAGEPLPGLPQFWPLIALVALAVLDNLTRLVQLAACISIGLATGLSTGSRLAALLAAGGALFALQLMLPIACSVCAWGVLQLAYFYETPALPGLISACLALAYQVVLAFIARGIAVAEIGK